MPDASTRPARRLPRMSLRLAMAAVLIFGVGLGWAVNGARRQAETARMLRDLGGKVFYDREHREALPTPDEGPKWLTDAIGPDFNHDITEIDLSSSTRGIDDSWAGRLGALPELDALRLGPSPGFTDAGLARLAGSKNLVILALDGTAVTGRGFAHLRGLERLRFFSAWGVPVQDADLSHLSGLGELDTLSLQGDEITDAGLAHLKSLGKLVALRLPTGRRMGITSAGLAHLSGLGSLRRLYLFASEIETLEPLRGLKSLDTIVLLNARLDDAGLEPIAGLTQLQELALSGADQRFGDAGLAHLAGLTSLTTLWLSDTRVGDPGLAHLARLPKLAELNLDGTRVTDAGLAHLATLGLKTLSLNRTAITDAGLEKLPRCREIQLKGTGVTEAGVAGLKGKFPGIRVVR